MLTDTHRTFETPCGAYGHFKITRSLLKITRDSRYGDSMERVLYNTILGAKPTTPEGETFYYSDYHQSATKFFRGEKWPCCSGTFIQLAADYGISAYLVEDDGIWVNLYVPSEVTVQIGGRDVRLTQATQYPLANTSRIEVHDAGKFKLALRIPGWAVSGTRITVNGRAVRGVKPGFVEVSRTWKAGDVVEVIFDMGLRLEPLNAAHPEMVAVVTGPLVLFPIAAPETPLPKDVWLSATQRTSDTWTVATDSGEIQLKPFMAITDETYRLYNRINV